MTTQNTYSVTYQLTLTCAAPVAQPAHGLNQEQEHAVRVLQSAHPSKATPSKAEINRAFNRLWADFGDRARAAGFRAYNTWRQVGEREYADTIQAVFHKCVQDFDLADGVPFMAYVSMNLHRDVPRNLISYGQFCEMSEGFRRELSRVRGLVKEADIDATDTHEVKMLLRRHAIPEKRIRLLLPFIPQCHSFDYAPEGKEGDAGDALVNRVEDESDWAANPSKRLETKEAHAIVNRVIGTLKPTWQALVKTCHGFADAPAENITEFAKQREISKSAVTESYGYAMKKIQQQLPTLLAT